MNGLFRLSIREFDPIGERLSSEMSLMLGFGAECDVFHLGPYQKQKPEWSFFLRADCAFW